MSILAGGQVASAKSSALVRSYLAAANWSSAAVVLRTLPREESKELRRAFATAVASAIHSLSPSDEKRIGVFRRWIALAQEFQPESEALAEARRSVDEIAARATIRGEAEEPESEP